MKIEIISDAKCKHCSNRVFRANGRNQKQSYCKVKEEFIKMNDLACKDFKL